MEQVVHILNGQEMYKHFKKTRFLENELMVPFNEAMCYGRAHGDIFSETFFQLRAKVHEVTIEQYNEMTLEPLQPLLAGEFTRIVMWFDADMFCQINLLTVLGWLDQVNYAGEAHLHLVDEHFELFDKFELHIKGYKSLYNAVLMMRSMPEHLASIEPAPLRNGIELYLNYAEPHSELMTFIHENIHFPQQQLLELLLTNFQKYGLGDIQYEKLIESARGGA